MPSKAILSVFICITLLVLLFGCTNISLSGLEDGICSDIEGDPDCPVENPLPDDSGICIEGDEREICLNDELIPDIPTPPSEVIDYKLKGEAMRISAITTGATCPNEWEGTGSSKAPCQITECGELTESLSYVLEKDINELDKVTCFEIKADYVVLDLGNHTLTGSISSSGMSAYYGIKVEDYNWTVISNGVIEKFSTGIFIKNSKLNALFNLVVKTNGSEGILIESSPQNFLSSIVSIGNGHRLSSGISFKSSNHNVLKDVNAISNRDERANASSNGIEFYYSSDNRLTDVRAESNDGSGIELMHSNRNRMTNIVSNSNGQGVSGNESSDNNIFNIVVNGSAVGIVWHNSENNRFTQVDASSNRTTGIMLNNCFDNILTDVNVNHNGYPPKYRFDGKGIVLYGSSRNEFNDVNASLNRLEGIVFNASSENILNRLTVSRGNYGIKLVADSNKNSLTNIVANNSNIAGIFFEDSSDNNLTNISASGNGSSEILIYSLSENNRIMNLIAEDDVGNAIKEYHGELTTNYLIYKNNFGEVYWETIDLTTAGKLSFPGTIEINDESVFIDITEFNGNLGDKPLFVRLKKGPYDEFNILEDEEICVDCFIIETSEEEVFFSIARLDPNSEVVFTLENTLAECPGGMNQSGTSSNPCKITTCEQLQSMNEALELNYILTKNVDCSATINWNSAKRLGRTYFLGFEPIGSETEPFVGKFNGNNFSINGLNSSWGSNKTSFGLFGYAKDAHISNVDSREANISGTNYVGGIVGYNENSEVIGSKFSGNLSGVNYMGGIAGFSSGLIQNSEADAIIQGENAIGGIVGLNNGELINSQISSQSNAIFCIGYNYLDHAPSENCDISEDRLISYYPLDEDGRDLKSNFNAINYGATNIQGKVGGAFNFNGNSYLKTKQGFSHNGKQFMISFWINTKEDVARTVLFKGRRLSGGGPPSNYNDFWLRVRSAKYYNWFYTIWEGITDGSHGELRTHVENPISDEWSHIVIAYDSTQTNKIDRRIVYVDGKRIDDYMTQQYPIKNHILTFNSIYPLDIGGSDREPYGELNGALDELKIFNSVLTLNEIKALSSTFVPKII